MQSINIAIAEDHLLVREGIVTMLTKEEDFNVLYSVSNGLELIENMKLREPNIVLLDIKMPVMDGKEAFKIIKEIYPKVKIIMLSMHFNETYIYEFMSSGAAGFLPKNCGIEKLVDAIYSVYEQGHYYDNSISESLISRISKNEKFLSHSNEDILSDRQIDIIKLLYDEKTPEEISKILFLSKRTVEWHKTKIFEKTNTKSLVGLIKYALSNGIIGS